jgi:iron complex outermembrane receptor protein
MRQRSRHPSLIVALLCAGFVSGSARAEAPEPSAPPGPAPTAAPKTPGSIVPPVLREQVAPAYPAAALPEKLSGDVVILVTVGADGGVREVTHSSGGPEVFVAPALEAARALRFDPATRDGAPVGVKVPVHFHFAPPPESLVAEEPDTLVVQAVRDPTAGETHAVTVVDAERLEQLAGNDLAETLQEVPGVALARTSGDTTKPIVRGHQERRILVLFDGVRHESQKWGLDHATEIDPFAAGSVHVVKGAAGVHYGPDAVGGVVLVEPPPLRDTPGVGGKAQTFYEHNGARAGGALRLDGAFGTLDGLAWRLEADGARGADLRAPTYVLGNTASQTWNTGLTLARRWEGRELSVAWHHYDLSSGVSFATGASSVEELLEAASRDAPLGAEAWSSDYAIERPSQAVTHDTARARARWDLEDGAEAQVTYAFQLNHRQEFDRARDSVEGPQFDFTLRTHSLDASAGHRTLEVPWGGLKGDAGLALSFQENVYSGLPLVPNFRSLQGGAHVAERLTRGLLAFEAGARYDRLSRTTYLTPQAFGRAVARGGLPEDACALAEDAARCPATYDAGTVTLGTRWMPRPDALELRLDLSSATRFPNADELYMSGAAPTSPVLGVGDAGLGPETTWGVSPTIEFGAPWLRGEVSAFANLIDDYIYFAPAAPGEPSVDVTAQGAFPRYTFRAIDARFWGVDGGVSLLRDAPVRLDVQGALVRAQDRATGDGLALIPADRVRAQLATAPRALGVVEGLTGSVGVQHVWRQTRVPARADLVPTPAAYTLLDADLSAKLPVGEDRSWSFGIAGTNLLNTRYRDATSLLRYFADEPGRSVRVRASATF